MKKKVIDNIILVVLIILLVAYLVASAYFNWQVLSSDNMEPWMKWFILWR